MECPSKSGMLAAIPEVDRAQWFTVTDALIKLNSAQRDLVHQLTRYLTR